ncbi:hypothetical protein F4810DRAFT_405418 [Camillea tinctor]|nr:hypothetical protein F4810DRAFT_405418 [Camillea tinctor]
MIRNPLYSTVSRSGRADLCRVTEGIAASLRHFSTAQRLQQESNDDSPGSKKKKAADAFSELLSTTVGNENPRPNIPTRAPAAAAASPTPNFSSDTFIGDSNNLLRPQNVIRVSSLPSRGGARGGGPNVIRGAPIIRGGFRGGFRGRGDASPGMRSNQPGLFDNPANQPRYTALQTFPNYSNSFQMRETIAAAHGARGGNIGRRGVGKGRGRGGGGRGGRRRREGDEKKDNKEEEGEDWEDPKVLEWREDREMGAPVTFNPVVTLDSLAGYGPAVATGGTPQAVGELALRQARILGGGMPFEENAMLEPDEVRQRYRHGEGVFFPSQRAKDLTLAQHKKHHRTFDTPSEEATTAVLEAAVLGRYDGPAYVPLDSKDPLAHVRNYVRRDNSWSADACRRIEEKIRGLLPNTPSAGGGGARAQRRG